MLLKPGQNFFSARQIDFKNLTSIELKLGEKIVGGVQLISPPHTGFFFYHKIIRYSRIFLHLNDVFNFVHMYFFLLPFIVINFSNILLNDPWRLFHQNSIIFSLIKYVVLITMKWRMFLKCLIIY